MATFELGLTHILTRSGDGYCDSHDLETTYRTPHGLWRGMRHDLQVSD